MIQVLLAEDHNIVRNGIRILLETDSSMFVVGEATNGMEVLKQLQEDRHVDIILADINMPEMDGISLLREVRKINPLIKIMMLSMHDNLKYVSESFREGASGYLLKSIDAQELIFALKHVHGGGQYICAEISLALLSRTGTPDADTLLPEDCGLEFTVKEIEVLQLIASGFTNQEMATKLSMSKRTVEGHRQTLIEKTGSRNTATLIRFAVLHHIIS